MLREDLIALLVSFLGSQVTELKAVASRCPRMYEDICMHKEVNFE